MKGEIAHKKELDMLQVLENIQKEQLSILLRC